MGSNSGRGFGCWVDEKNDKCPASVLFRLDYMLEYRGSACKNTIAKVVPQAN